MKLSKYTTTVKDICESFIPSQELWSMDLSVQRIIDKTQGKFFDFDFPFYSEDRKDLYTFKAYFLLRYWNNYIGFETLGMWKTAFITKMYELTPYYTKLYDAIQNDNPFTNINVTFTETEKGNEKTTTNSTDAGESKVKNRQNYQNIDSDNPQVTVATQDYASSMSRGETVNDTTTSAKNNHAENDNKDSKRDRETVEKGLRGKSTSEAIAEYRKQIQNINRELVEACRDLFMKVW
jgi:hypothetical protein|nr:MAG TPA: Lower collar protein [Bacteriophage sp.]